MNDDLINRQDAIDFIDAGRLCNPNELRWSDNEVVNFLKSRPSAQSERMKGKWEIYIISMLDGEGCKCSECGFEGVPYWNFCPNCGAYMHD